MDSSDFNDKTKRILMYAFIPIIIIGFIYVIHRDPQKRLKEEPTCFTKTIQIDFSSTADGYPIIDYKFIVNGKIYKGFNGLDDSRDKIKDVMKVRYICDDPEVSEIVYDEK